MLVAMSPRRLSALVLTIMLAGCSMVRQNMRAPTAVTQSQPVAAATVWPAPGGDLRTCAPAGPTGDAPVPRGPADTVKVRNKTMRQVLATLCSFSVPAPKTNNGTWPDPLR